jgi:hypothetical protein
MLSWVRFLTVKRAFEIPGAVFRGERNDALPVAQRVCRNPGIGEPRYRGVRLGLTVRRVEDDLLVR